MKNILRSLTLLLAISAINAVMYGQTAMTQTTLSAGISANTSKGFVVVASATGITAPGVAISQGGLGGAASTAPNYTLLYVDRELMRVNGVNSTTITVERGYSGTIATAHISGAVVWVGPPGYFHNFDPSGGCGGATGTSTVTPSVAPWIVYTTGNMWGCNANNQWATFTDYTNSPTAQLVAAAIASATTIAPTVEVFHVSGTTAIATITVPANMQAGQCLYLIPSGIFTTTTAGNIGLASTAVVGKTLIECWDGASFFPSY